MITSIWPYELQEIIEEKHKKGESVDPRLETLARTLKPDDNPILILAHLKQTP